MQFCIRQQITFANSDSRLRNLRGVPIELAFPAELQEFLDGKDRLGDVAEQVKAYEVPVRSVHAPEGHLADAGFPDWAGSMVQFAEAVGAGIIVFHPEPLPSGDEGKQRAALDNILHLQDRTRVAIALETFWDSRRVITPDAIMQNQMPMVLDTSRLPKSEVIWAVESYYTHIVNIHLSAVTRDSGLKGIARPHQPIDRDGFCMDLLDRLHEMGWYNVVTLEYMPWLHEKVLEDRRLLERIYGPPKL